MLSLVWVLFVLPALVAATSFYTNATVPGNLTVACTNALLADVACDPIVPALQSGDFYPDTTLARACTTGCAAALSTFQQNVDSACSADTWLGYENQTMPVAIIPDLLRYHFNMTCLTNQGRFCNNVAAAYAAYLDPNATGNAAPANGLYGNITITDPCDLCLVVNLQFQAESPYYDGPDLWSSSIYQSKTSSCGITGMGLTSVPMTVYTPTTTTPAPAPTCSGTSYTIQSGDDCHSISLSQGISTSWLLQDNALSSGCVNFPTSGTLCLVNTCKVYTVQTNDTCDSIAKSYNVTVPQLKAWNPNVNAGCYNIDSMVGDQLCVDKPGKAYVTPPAVTLAPTIPTTPAPIPTDVAAGTNTYCGQYYKAILGDYCNLLVLKFGITLPDFVFLNPAINENCTNLFAEESYCVQAVGDINTYSGRPGYISYTASITSFSGDPATRWPVVNFTTPTRTGTSELSLATGTRSDCFQYFNGTSFLGKVTSGSFYSSDCDLAAHVFMVSLEDLAVWNPSLGNTSLSNCTFLAGEGYCGQYWLGDIPKTTVSDTGGDPIRDNTTPNCTQYVDVFDGSGFTCQNIPDDFGITISQFFAWNPAVGADCSNLWLGYQYCVAGPGGPGSGSSTTSAPPTTTTGPGAPTQPGQPANCNKWYIVQSGDSCSSVENAFFITSEQFLSWNPAVSSDCLTGFWADYAYCVGTTDTVSITRSAPPTSTSSAPGSTVTAPDPHQDNNAVSNCNKFAQAQTGDYCYLFAQNNGITTDQLYAWNAVLGSDGSGCGTEFWAGYWYCVGVSS
ncbi:hypothetical protein GQ53DRAFT_851663 [Thozetella sp. PMI_491]|nr:hypothetical protein GQ53DRAFT_851663 [Thozetella sp. PMI_491]